jgi:hypothetical protein
VANRKCHDFSNCRTAADNHAGGEGNHGRELFRLELPPVLVLEAGAGARGGSRIGPAAGAGHPAGPLPAHPVLPEALPLLLLSGLYGQGFHGHQGYLELAIRELELYGAQPFIGGRKPQFVYFGGGTPSYLSESQLQHLADRMKAILSWDEAEEVTFECEPGTLTDHKLKVIREIGVTRLSLGVENFNDHVLEINGRAHRSPEIRRAYHFARELDFPQINIDLIAGMVEETEENWRDSCVRPLSWRPTA